LVSTGTFFPLYIGLHLVELLLAKTVELVFIIFFVIFYDAPFFIAEIFSRVWFEFSIFLCNPTFFIVSIFFLLLLFSSSMLFFSLKIGAPDMSGPHPTVGVCAYIFISGKETLAIIGAEYIPKFQKFSFQNINRSSFISDFIFFLIFCFFFLSSI